IASDCIECQRVQNLPPRLVHPWEWPTTPWQRLHLDFAGPFMGSNFLIVVDAHSKCYRRTPHSTTCESPSLLLLNRQLRTRLDLIKPNMAQNVANKQETSIRNPNTYTFTANDKVAVKIIPLDKPEPIELPQVQESSNGQVETPSEIVNAESGEASVPIENSSKDISTNITTSNISDTSNEQLTVKARRGRGPARSYGPPTRRSERLINQRKVKV
ncbi:uncharacterized protein B4U79_06255, partial [Dinothrombium tinctorium]